MKLYLITRKDIPSSDEYVGHIIAAKDPAQVRSMASEAARDEGKEPWLNPKMTYLTCIAKKSEYQAPGVVMSDFLNG